MSAQRSRLSKRRRVGIVLAAVVVSVVVAWIGVSLIPRAAPSSASTGAIVTINGERWTISYASAASGYFAPPQGSMLRACPMTEPVGGQFSVTISLTNLAASSSHTIERIALDGPFSLIGTSQSLPISVPAGGTTTITLTVQTPGTGGSYFLSGAIFAS